MTRPRYTPTIENYVHYLFIYKIVKKNNGNTKGINFYIQDQKKFFFLCSDGILYLSQSKVNGDFIECIKKILLFCKDYCFHFRPKGAFRMSTTLRRLNLNVQLEDIG